LWGLRDFVLEEVRWGEGVVAADCSGWLEGGCGEGWAEGGLTAPVFGGFFVADVFVLDVVL
jgi:hypothetical protein